MMTSWNQPVRTEHPKRVVWEPHEKVWLARQVGRDLVKDGVDATALDKSEVEDLMMAPLRRAVNRMEPHRRRELGGPSHVAWLYEYLVDMFEARNGLGDKYPPDYLDEPPLKLTDGPRPTSEHYYPPSPEGDEGEYIIPPGFCLVGEAQWAELNTRVGEMAEQVRRRNRKLRRLEQTVEGLTDSLSYLSELLLEAVPLIGRAADTPDVPDDAPVRRAKMSLVVVAGVRPRDQQHIRERTHEFAEVVFADSRRVSPERVGDCDWLVATRLCGAHWIRRARETFPGKLSEVSGLSGVTREVLRVARGV